jgi:hypothetical protein
MKFTRVDGPRHITTAYGVPADGTYHVLTEVVCDMFGPYPTVVAYVIRKPDGKLARAYMHAEPDPDLPAPAPTALRLV